jgi:DNA polymerase III delta prime subunit
MIEPIQSRCKVLTITPPSKTEVAKHVAEILDKEEIKYKLLFSINGQFNPFLGNIA